MSAKDLKSSDIHRETSAVYGHECMCKGRVYRYVTKFKTDIASLHDADRPEQAYKGHGALVAKESGQRAFSLLELRRWFIGNAVALQSKGPILVIQRHYKAKDLC